MAQMTADEITGFLTAGTRTAKVATTRVDGSPHVAPVWFVLDGDDIVFMTGAGTVKGKSLLRDGRVALTVDDEHPPYAFVLVEGQATTSTDLEEMLPLSVRIAHRYMGAEQADRFGRRNAVEGELLVRLRPAKIVAIKDLAD